MSVARFLVNDFLKDEKSIHSNDANCGSRTNTNGHENNCSIIKNHFDKRGENGRSHLDGEKRTGRTNHSSGVNVGYMHNNFNSEQASEEHNDIFGGIDTYPFNSCAAPSAIRVDKFPLPSMTTRREFSNAHRSFWANELATLPQPPPRCSFAKPPGRNEKSSRRKFHISAVLDGVLYAGIRGMCAKLGVTSASFFFAALDIMLSRTLETDDELCLALEVQPNPSFTDVGDQFLPVRLGPILEKKAADVVRTAHARLEVALQHRNVDMLALLDQLDRDGGSDCNWRECIPAAFSYKLLPKGSVLDSREYFAASDIPADEDGSTTFDLRLQVVESEDTGCAYVTLTEPERLYTHYDAESLKDRYLEIIRAMHTDPSSLVKDCALFDLTEGQRTVHLGKGRRIQFDEWPATLLHKIDEVARSVPQSIAAKDSLGKNVTYFELLQHAGAISNVLLQRNLSKGARVAVYCEPGIDSLYSLLAITRIGCIYIPLDIRNPVERLASLVKDCRPSIIIHHDATAQDAVHMVHGDLELLNIAALSQDVTEKALPCITSKSLDPAFVLYTSGSTGHPKGVLLSHANFLGQIAAVQREFSLERERVLQQSSLGFDTSLHQIFVALTTGGTVIIANRDIRGDASKLAELMLAERVTFTVAVPSEYSVLLRYGNAPLRQYSDWKFAVSGGERMTSALKQEFCALKESAPTLLSCYGPTEVALASSFGILSYSDRELGADDENSPVGFTLPNYSAYILDEKMRPVPAGFPGEVYIGGVGVACGYLHNEKLSMERFLPDPFAAQEDLRKGWSRMYKTGDKGRLLPSGALSFLGRIDGDSQVKLRGIRIELEEVANVIITTSQGVLHQAAVIVKGSSEHKYMLSYVTFSPDRQPHDVRSYLQRLLESLPLPIYMRPVALLRLEQMPTNVNGKLDRRALSLKSITDIQRKSSTHDGNAGSTEKRLRGIWEEVIGSGSQSQNAFQIALNSDFFQVGGNSILLVELQKRISDAFGQTIKYSDLFLVSVLKDMAAEIDGKRDTMRCSVINWTGEIEESLHQVSRPIDSNMETRKQVLLTGSTGFLGSHLLRQLVNSPRVCKVHAVAVRHHHLKNQSHESGSPFSQISSQKLQIWQGDLSFPDMGLSTTELAHLADTVDIIIHNGADVSFLKSYQSLHATNVDSTIVLSRLALKRKIPFHFVSSAGVLRLAHDVEPIGEVSMAAYPPPSDGSDGYIASKWASEQILERAAKQKGLPVYIHRPTSIVGKGSPQTDVIANLLRFSRIMGAVPNFPHAHGVFNMVRVEDVADRIVHDGLSSAEEPGKKRVDRDGASGLEAGQVRWIHHVGAEQILPEELCKLLQDRQRDAVRKLSLKEWVAEAVALGLNEKVAEVFSTPEAARGHGITIPRLL